MSQRTATAHDSHAANAAEADGAPGSSGSGGLSSYTTHGSSQHAVNNGGIGGNRAHQSAAMQQCHERAANARFVQDTGIAAAGGGGTRAVIDWEDPKIKEEVCRKIWALEYISSAVSEML